MDLHRLKKLQWFVFRNFVLIMILRKGSECHFVVYSSFFYILFFVQFIRLAQCLITNYFKGLFMQETFYKFGLKYIIYCHWFLLSMDTQHLENEFL